MRDFINNFIYIRGRSANKGRLLVLLTELRTRCNVGVTGYVHVNGNLDNTESLNSILVLGFLKNCTPNITKSEIPNSMTNFTNCSIVGC